MLCIWGCVDGVGLCRLGRGCVNGRGDVNGGGAVEMGLCR